MEAMATQHAVYGSLLNRYFRFSDPRFGQSVTLSGRVVTKHMCQKANELIDGEYRFGPSILAGDTDSCYVTLKSLMDDAELRAAHPDDRDRAVAIADLIGDEINSSFPARMAEAFFIDEARGATIKAGREVVASAGLFKNKKKRYALAVFDKEGVRKKSLKIMGMDTQRTDTPKFIQEFLKECIRLAVEERKSYEDLYAYVAEFRRKFRQRDPWTVGTSGRVSNLRIGSQLRIQFEQGRIDNPRTHHMVIAADNTNRMIQFHNEKSMDMIRDGDKIESIPLKRDSSSNPMDLGSIAIPVGATNLPEWFRNLPYDTAAQEKKLLDQKLENIFGILGWSFEVRDSGADDVFG
jgi:DNA polymerase elongation subunit (family B)